MILAAFLIATILFITWFAYEFYFWPQKQMKRYKKLFQSLGYKASLRTFSFLNLGMIQQMKKAQKQLKDAFYYDKYQFNTDDITIFNALGKPLISINNPQLTRQFLSAEVNIKYPKLYGLIRGVREVLGNGIAFTEGLVWKNKRKIISKAFNFELLKANIPKIVEICNKNIQKFHKDHQIDENTAKYNVVNLAIRFFNGVMLKCFFGCDEVNQTVKGKSFQEFIIQMINKAAKVSLSPLILLFGLLPYNLGITKQIRDTKQLKNIFRSIAGQIIKKRSEEVKKETKPKQFTDIIQSLIYQRNHAKENNQIFQYSDRDLIDEFSTFLVAGTDTSSRYFTMIIYYITQNPEIQKRLRKDVSEVIKCDTDITYENLKKLVYIDWIQYQTTRYYGPGNGLFIRSAETDNYISNVPITKGTLVTIQPLSNHYNPKYFKDPHIFRPQRWQSQCDKIHPNAFLGFSGGPRNCIGKQLAHLQTKIALIKLLMTYKSFSIPDKDITLCSNFLYEPSPFETIFSKK